MDVTSSQTTYRETGFYSSIILDYLEGNQQLNPFYKHPVSLDGIKAAIEERKLYNTDRKLLVDVLQKHYEGKIPTPQQQFNIKQVGNSNCFTITTAHQPNIFTGHLYFIYKILHTIKLCKQLKADMPENDFVPIFYMGSEDADLEELGHVYINGYKHAWNTKQTGGVGRMKVDKALIKLLDDIEGEVAVHPHGNKIIELMKICYTEDSTIELATFKLINALFGEFGLIVLLPEDAGYKKAFVPVVEKELIEGFSHSIVAKTVSAFPKHYKIQASGRELNMFYLKDDMRERIISENSKFKVQNSAIEFDEAGLLSELRQHPERFSPNVILRPVFQEMILPNIAFIGGGGELAYWLELKNVFAAVNVPFPVLILRNSFMLVEKKHTEKIRSLGFTTVDLFRPEHELLNVLIKKESKVQLSLEKERQITNEFYATLKITAVAVDKTLQPHTEALEKLAIRKINSLEKKMLRAEKKKFEAQQRQLRKLRSQLFPYNNLQERIENFMPLYAKYGGELIKQLHKNSLGLEQEFVTLSIN